MLEELKNPWLVAVWPGMGGVAQIAGSYLVRQLGAEPVAELDPGSFFELHSITVRQGLVQPAELPRSVFYAWKDPEGRRDLLVMLGGRQPDKDGYRYAQAVIDVAAKYGVERVFTFAAMATPIHPTAEPRVFGVCTRQELLSDLSHEGITLLEEGEVSGLNGIFVAAAAARDLPATCLLGEFPFFAATIPNPKASTAVLRVFSDLAGFEVDLNELIADARKIERDLVQHLEGLQRAAQLAAHAAQPEEEQSEFPITKDDEDEPRKLRTSPEVLERIERLFKQAKTDRSTAIELKAELDRHGLFREFEDRFLDLFKQAG